MTALMELTPAQARAAARRMYEGGWAIVDIQRYLADRGHARCWETIKGWADPEWADRRRKAHQRVTRRHYRKRAGVIAYRVLDEDAKLDTIRRLRDEGLGAGAIAGAMRVFVGDDLTRNQVRYAFEQGQYPRKAAA